MRQFVVKCTFYSTTLDGCFHNKQGKIWDSVNHKSIWAREYFLRFSGFVRI